MFWLKCSRPITWIDVIIASNLILILTLKSNPIRSDLVIEETAIKI